MILLFIFISLSCKLTRACVVVLVPSREWSVCRELANVVETTIHCSRQEAFVTQDLETALKKFRPDFISLLQNPVNTEQ